MNEESTYFNPHDLEGRIMDHLASAGIHGRIVGLLKQGFARAMAGEVAIISRKDREQLFARCARNVLEAVMQELEAGSG